MSILIPGMKMPKSCADCPIEFYDENYYGDESNHRCAMIYKGYTSDVRQEKRREDCPLIELPPHGRLIDADALKIYQMEENVRADGDPNEYEYDAGLIDGMHMAAKDVSVAPTIIPAEGGADG